MLQSWLQTVMLGMQAPCCSGTFPGGFAHVSPRVSCRLFVELRAPRHNADIASGRDGEKT